MTHKNKKCLISVQDDCLLIANGGEPFSRTGVIGVCASYLGTKHDYKPVDPDLNQPDEELVSSIRARELGTYKNDLNRITSDYRGEEETRLDYGGRAVWELLQNVDDAIAPFDASVKRLIGAKGIGFKSVLEISSEPEIHSGPFHFNFSSKQIRALLIEKKLSNDPPPLTFRIPFDKEPDEKVIELLTNYSTVIRLPFRSDNKEIKEQVAEWLKKYDAGVLLFSQYLEELSIQIGDDFFETRKIFRSHNGGFTDDKITIERICKGSENTTEEYFRWAETWASDEETKHHSVIICLPCSKDDDFPVPAPTTNNLYVFFPTEEQLPFRAYIHASFDLEQNRKHVRSSESESNILDKFSILLRRIIRGKFPAETILKAFVPEPALSQDTIGGKIWKKFQQTLTEESFVPVFGGNFEKPSDCFFWNYNIVDVLPIDADKVKNAKLVCSSLLKDLSCRSALKNLGSQELDFINHADLLSEGFNYDEESCCKTLKCLYDIVYSFKGWGKEKEEFFKNCRKVSCWWTITEYSRSLLESKPLFRKKLKDPLPSWLPIDFLSDKFLVKLADCDPERKKTGEWTKLLEGFLFESEHENFLYHGLYPALKEKNDTAWWEKYGWSVLDIFGFLVNPGQNNRLIWEEDKRKVLGESIRLPTNNGWLPAILCYAGQDWDGPEKFDTFFDDIPERGVITGPDKWEIIKTEKEVPEWKNRLGFIGVSWTFKLVRWHTSEENGKKISKNRQTECPFSQGVNNEHWEQYCLQLSPPLYHSPKTAFDWDAKIYDQWVIEYFPEILPLDSKNLLGMILLIPEKISELEMKYVYEKSGGYSGVKRDTLESFATWQFHNIGWVPTKKCFFYSQVNFKPSETYLPGKGLGGMLPEININLPEGQDRRNAETILTQRLMIREELPLNNDPKWSELISLFPKVAPGIEDAEKVRKYARKFYKALFNMQTKTESISEPVLLPSTICCNDESQESINQTIWFLPPEEIYLLDEHYLTETTTKKELLRKFNLYLLELDEGQKAVNWFGVNRLSEHVEVEPIYEREENQVTIETVDLYRERLYALRLLDKQIKIPEPDDLNLKVVRQLRLNVIVDGNTLASPTINSWPQGEVVFVDSENVHRGLGMSLAPGNKRKIADSYENILRASSWAEIIERLGELGIPPEALKDLEPVSNDITSERECNQDNQIIIDEIVVNYGNIENNNSIILSQRELDYDHAKENNGKYIADNSTHHSNIANNNTFSNIDVSHKEKHGGNISQIRRQRGLAAEVWLRHEVDKILPDDWEIDEETGGGNFPYDVKIINGMNFKFIEVKTFGPEIFISELEIEFAKANKYNYYIVLISDVNNTGERKAYWIFDPLITCATWLKSGNWKWTKDKRTIEVPQAWVVPELPSEEQLQMRPRFSFILYPPEKIKLTEGFDKFIQEIGLVSSEDAI